ncbi:MAG: tetratricopeptide repeat protein [Bacteroidetes bacterium]|nr:tetratricopeptide repeat protein [Bacteroidota bacterium]MBU1115289.1 tetratricopeptide repeat protein [Bacteroidota bacterium]MBU1800155.1 tetratricopeptide repeat protein [Bacteroidota bacterium]
MSFPIKIAIFILLFVSSVYAQKNSFEAMKRQGIIHMENGKYGEAIDLFNKYITANPQEAEGYNLRALSYEKRKIYEYAVLDFRRAINLTPNNSEYKENLNRVISIWYPILYKKIEGHKREIAIDPLSAFDYLEIGKSYRWLEEWKLAELWYDKYLALDDDASPDEIIRYSIILAKTGSIKKGERVLKKWVDRYPDDWRLWSRYGYFTLWLGNRDNAANAFRSSLSFKPFFKEAQDGLDIATEKGYMVKNEPRAYDREYPIDAKYKKLNKNPGNSETRFELVGLLIEANRIEEAREQLNILKSDYENTDEYKELEARLTPLMVEKYTSLLEESLAKLKQDPNDKTIVKNVADYFVRLQKYDEANEIMQEYLALQPNDYEMKEYYADILAYSGDFDGAAKILLELIENGYSSNEIIQKAASYYGNDFDYDSSINVIENYIKDKPIESIKDMKFQLAQYYAWNYQWDDARDQVDELLEVYPNNNKYKLFASQLIVWTVDDSEFETAEVNFKDVLLEDPNSLEGLLGLATIYSWKRDYPTAKQYIDTVKKLYPDNSEITTVESFYNAQLSLEDGRKRLEKRAEIGKLVAAEDYNGALELFLEYFDMDPEPSPQVYKEYAQINIAAERYDTAIETYDNLLANEYDEQIAYERASAYLWKGDSLNALNQFLELSKNNPENYDFKLGLAESYIMNQEYGNADDVYDELLDIVQDTVQENYIIRRKDMLPMYGISAGLNSAFQYMIPQNISFVPMFTFYDDNQELTYYQYGLRAEIGLFRYFTVGGTWLRTDIFSLTNNQTLTELSGQLYFHPFTNFAIGGSLGRLNIEREIKKNIGSLEARWYSSDLILSVGYKDTDARLVLFSPKLINISADIYLYYFSGNYRYKNKYKFLLFYQYFNISDGNLANDFRFRLGKAFQENIFWGYEYFFSDFGFSSVTYYSPQEFSTHSIWLDYEYKKVKNLDLIFGGEIGYAPSVDFIVGNIYADASYKVLENLLINGRATYGNSYRFNSSYQFISIFISAYWSIW